MADDNKDNEMQPFEQGVVAARTGVGRDANPYEPKTPGYSDWNAGYDNFKDADEEVSQEHLRGAPRRRRNRTGSMFASAAGGHPFQNGDAHNSSSIRQSDGEVEQPRK